MSIRIWKRSMTLALVFALLVVFILPQGIQIAFAAPSAAEYAKGEAVFLADTEEEAVQIAEAYRKIYPNAVLSSFSYGVGVLSGITEELNAVRAESLSEKLGIDLPLLERNYIVTACEIPDETRVIDSLSAADGENNPEPVTGQSTRFNDPYLTSMWHIDAINMDTAWSTTEGNDDVLVAVIDSGIDYNHSDLAANIAGYYDFCSWDDQADGGLDPYDNHSHGTHVAGIIAAVANNNSGVAGIAPKVKILSLKVLERLEDGSGSAGGYDSDILRAFRFAIDSGADVINMSLGGSEASTAFQTLIDEAEARGIVTVAAAGNDNTNQKTYPGAYNNLLAVAALNNISTSISYYARASYSNYGDWVDIAAPGSSIFSTYPGEKLAYKSGTSMAAPVVAGVAALMLSCCPGLNASDAMQILQDTAVVSDSNGTYYNDGYAIGAGMVNAGAAVQSANNTAAVRINTYGPFLENGLPVALPSALSFKNLTETSASFQYYTDAQGTTLTTTAVGATAQGGAPALNGVYYVRATVGDVTSPLYCFQIGNSIETIDLQIMKPITGFAPSTKAVSTVDDVSVASVAWNPTNSVFQANTAYTVTAVVENVEPNDFAASVTAKVNGNTAAVTRNSDGTIGVSYTFPATIALNRVDTLEETFETTSATLGDWVQEDRNSTVEWAFQKGSGSSGGVTTAHGGECNASLYVDAYGKQSTMLVSPFLNLNNSAQTYVLSFWYCQPQWGTDVDQLSVYYRTAGDQPWILLQKFPDNMGDWTQFTIALPNASSMYQIGFCGEMHWGYGLGLDDVSVVPGTVVSSVAIQMSAPETLASAAGVTATAVSDQAQCSVSGVTWEPADANFTAGTAYTAHVAVSVTDHVVYSDTVAATINGQPATVVRNSSQSLSVSYTFAATGTAELRYQDSFESGLAAWKTLDGDGDGASWTVDATKGTQNGSAAVSKGAQSAQENWLISPLLALESASALTFRVRADSAVPSGQLIVSISQTGTSKTEFSTQLIQIPLAQESAFTASVPAVVVRDGEWLVVTLALSSYQNGAYIALCHSAAAGDPDLLLDDFSMQVCVDALTLQVSEPYTGFVPSPSVEISGNAVVNEVAWTPDGGFAEQTAYTVTCTLQSNEGSLCYPGMPVTINGHTAVVSSVSANSAVASYTFAATAASSDPLYTHNRLVTDPETKNGYDLSVLQGTNADLGTAAELSGGNWIADQFTVNAETTLRQLAFDVVQKTAANLELPAIEGVYVRIFADNAGALNPEACLFGDSSTNCFAVAGWTGIYRAASASASEVWPVMRITANGGTDWTLPAGTYWLAVSFAAGEGTEILVPACTVQGQTLAGSAVRLSGNTWSAWKDSASETQSSMPFTLYGDQNAVMTFVQSPAAGASASASVALRYGKDQNVYICLYNTEGRLLKIAGSTYADGQYQASVGAVVSQSLCKAFAVKKGGSPVCASQHVTVE